MVKINEAGCAGCGLCASLCPQGFEMVDRIAKIRDDSVDCIRSVATACPRNVIILDDTQAQSPPPINRGGGQSRGMGQGTGRGRGQGGHGRRWG